MFLIFHELRPDVLPVDDIGLQRAIALHYHDGERVDAAAMRALAVRVAAVAQRRHLVPVALARPAAGRVLSADAAQRDACDDRCGRALVQRLQWRDGLRCRDTGCRRTPVRRTHARRRARRARQRRLRRRRPAAGAQQLREPRLPGLARRRAAAGREVLPAGALDATRRSARSTRSSQELAAREIPVVAPLARRRRDAARVRRLPLRRLSASAAAARRSSIDRRRSNGWAASSAASTRSVRMRRSAIGRRSTSTASASSRATGCSRTTSFPPISMPAWRASPRWRSPACATATTAPATFASLRLHGDCHAGNVLWTDDGPHFVDFDDARIGPAVQDLWMLLSGDRAEMTRQLAAVLRGYEDFRELRPARAPPRRGAAHAAPHPLLGMARAALGRSGVPGGVPVVQHPALLAGPHPRAARAGRADGRAAAAVERREAAPLRRPVPCATRAQAPARASAAARRRPDAASDRCARRARDRA